jgi:hypothetical protein
MSVIQTGYFTSSVKIQLRDLEREDRKTFKGVCHYIRGYRNCLKGQKGFLNNHKDTDKSLSDGLFLRFKTPAERNRFVKKFEFLFSEEALTYMEIKKTRPKKHTLNRVLLLKAS